MNQILATGSIVLTRTDGTITYAHIRYSPNADGSNMTEKPNDATRYIGVCYNSFSEPPTDKNDYTWSLIKGSNGEDPKEIEKSAPIYKILDKFKTISVSASDWSTKYSRYYILKNNRYRQCTINDAWSSIETYYIIDTEAPIAPTTEVKANSPVDGWSLEIPTYIYGKQYWVCLQTVFQSSGSIPNTNDSITGMYLDENSDTIVNTIDDESIIDRTYFDANGNLIIELKEGEYGKHEDPNDNEYINSSYVDDNGQLVLVLNKSEIPIYEEVIWSEVVLHDGLNEANEKAVLAKDTSDDAYTMANGSVDKIIYWYCAATYGDNEKSPRAPNNTAGWFLDPSKTNFGKQIKINNKVQKYNYLWIYPIYYYRNDTNSNGINPSTSAELNNDKIQIYASVSNTMLGLWTFLAGDSIGEGATTINGGNITANSITATEIGTFGNFTIDTDSIHNPSTKNTFDNNEEGIYISGTNGIKLNAPNNIEFSVNSSTGLLTANNANITGNLYADKGYIGGNNGFIIDTNKIYKNKSTLKSSDGGIYLGTDGISITTSGTYSYNDISGYSSKSFIKDGDYYKSNFTSSSTDFTIGKISLSGISSGDIITVFYEICGDSNSTAIFGNLGVNSGTSNNTIKTNTTIDSTQICTQVNCSSGGSVKTGQISYTAVENANYNFFIVKIVGNKNSYVKFTLSVGTTNQEYTTTITNGILYTNKIIATDCEFSGNINVNNGVFKVDSAGNLVAQKATITGSLYAGANSKIGNFAFNGSSISYGTKGQQGSFYIGTDGFSIGDALLYDGSNLTFGPTVSIGWSNLPSTVAATSDIPSKDTITKITNDSIKTATISADQIGSGTITAANYQVYKGTTLIGKWNSSGFAVYDGLYSSGNKALATIDPIDSDEDEDPAKESEETGTADGSTETNSIDTSKLMRLIAPSKSGAIVIGDTNSGNKHILNYVGEQGKFAIYSGTSTIVGRMYIYYGKATRNKAIKHGYKCKLTMLSKSGEAGAQIVSRSSGGTRVTVGTTGILYRYTGSSRRWKHHITSIFNKENDPHLLYKLPVVQFKYKDDYISPEDSRYDRDMPGFIAEDIAKIYNIAAEYGEDGDICDWDEKYLVPPMLKLIQEQHTEIKELKEKLQNIESKLL